MEAAKGRLLDSWSCLACLKLVLRLLLDEIGSVGDAGMGKNYKVSKVRGGGETKGKTKVDKIVLLVSVELTG